MTKNDVIIHRLGDIDDKLGDIKEHLRNLNGKVEKHEASYQQNKVWHVIYRAGGSLIVVTVVSMAFKMFL